MKFTSKSALQIAIGILGLVPVLAGLYGVCAGAGFLLQAPAPIAMDSHFRYLSGLLLGIGLVFWSMIPTIEKQTSLFRALTVIVFVGGLGRLVSLYVAGVPDAPMLFGLGMELIVTPLLALWQYRVAKKLNR